MKLKIIIYIILLCFYSVISITSYSDSIKENIKNSSSDISNDNSLKSYAKVIDEYKAYISSVNPSVRKEITQFRVENAKLLKQKRDLYLNLSPEAQKFLKTEEIYRSRLPINMSDKIDLKNQIDIDSKQTN